MFRKRKVAAPIVFLNAFKKEQKNKFIRLWIWFQLARNDTVMREAIFSNERLAVTLRFFATDKKISSETFAIMKVALRNKILFRDIAKVECGLMLFKFVAD